VRISAFSTGRVRQKRGDRGIRRYLVNEWREETLPVNVFLVEHPDGLCLVDTGQRVAAAEPRYFPRWYPFFRLSRFELDGRDEAASQIEAAGLDVRRIRWVALTHLHTDHIGGLAAFQGAEVLVARAEWNLAQGLGGRLRGYLKKEWPSTLVPRLVDFDGASIGPFPRSHDIASDGRLLMVPLPGHTQGHAALLVRDGSASYLCAGDAAFGAGNFATTAPAVAEWCKREKVTVLLTHDDAARRLGAAAAEPR
jgi:N-acyl homoserine lactone hydrolase